MWFCQPIKRLEEILVSFLILKIKGRCKNGEHKHSISLYFVRSYIKFSNIKGRDIRADTREEADTRAKLDYIATAVDEIRLDNKARDREITEMREKVIRIEESVKSAHKRIDGNCYLKLI